MKHRNNAPIQLAGCNGLTPTLHWLSAPHMGLAAGQLQVSSQVVVHKGCTGKRVVLSIRGWAQTYAVQKRARDMSLKQQAAPTRQSPPLQMFVLLGQTQSVVHGASVSQFGCSRTHQSCRQPMRCSCCW